MIMYDNELKQGKMKCKQRIKLNHNIYNMSRCTNHQVRTVKAGERGSEWGGPLVGCRLKFSNFVGSRLKFSIFVGSRLNFSIFVGCRKISVNK